MLAISRSSFNNVIPCPTPFSCFHYDQSYYPCILAGWMDDIPIADSEYKYIIVHFPFFQKYILLCFLHSALHVLTPLCALPSLLYLLSLSSFLLLSAIARFLSFSSLVHFPHLHPPPLNTDPWIFLLSQSFSSFLSNVFFPTEYSFPMASLCINRSYLSPFPIPAFSSSSYSCPSPPAGR